MRQSILILLALVVTVPAAANVIFQADFEAAQPVTAQVVISPGFKLLTTMGETAALTAEVVAESGGAISAEIHWHSNDPATVSVTQDGTITAMQAAGSAQIIASAAGALPATIIVTVATPVAGALLIADEQVVEPPLPVANLLAASAMAPYGLGYQYTIVLQGIATPAVGDILIGTGETPLAGRVVSVSSSMGLHTVTLEVIGLDELFATLVIDERINLDRAPIVVDAAVSNLFDVTRYDDGSIVLRPRAAKGVQGTPVNALLDCGDSEVTNPLDILTVSTGSEVLIDPSISVDLSYDSDTGHFGLSGSGGINSAFELKPRAVAAFEGKISCKLKLAQLIIPIGGPLAWIFSGQIPIGAGVEISGKVTTTEQVGYDLTATGSQSFSASLECAPDCMLNSNLESSFDGAAKPVLPMVDPLVGNFELDLNGFLFAFASLKFGNPLFAALQFEALGVKAGIKQSGAFRTVAAQVADPNFASSFKLELIGDAGPGNDIVKFLELLTISPPSFNLFSIVLPLAKSPVGTLVITDPSGGSSASPGNPANVQPGSASELGELATFEVTLNPTTYLGLYSVEGVDIYWLRPDGMGGTTLEPGRPGCNSMSATEGQTVFTCQTDFTEEHLGQQTFYAFVRASLFGFEVPFPLEISADSTAQLNVTDSGDASSSYSTSVSLPGASESSQNCGASEVEIDDPPGFYHLGRAEAQPGSLRALVDTRNAQSDGILGHSRASTWVVFPNSSSSLDFVVELSAEVAKGWVPDDHGNGYVEVRIVVDNAAAPDSAPTGSRRPNKGGALELFGYRDYCFYGGSDLPDCKPEDNAGGGILAQFAGSTLTIPVSFDGTGGDYSVRVDIYTKADSGYRVDFEATFPSFGAGCDDPPLPD